LLLICLYYLNVYLKKINLYFTECEFSRSHEYDVLTDNLLKVVNYLKTNNKSSVYRTGVGSIIVLESFMIENLISKYDSNLNIRSEINLIKNITKDKKYLTNIYTILQSKYHCIEDIEEKIDKINLSILYIIFNIF
jgi:hypothetical protein